MALDSNLKAFATSGNFATLTTLGPDGMPSTHVMWVDADDDHLLINTEIERQKAKNVARDPRVAITIIDKETPYRYMEARGRVVETISGTEAREHIDAVSNRYTGGDYQQPIGSERVLLKVDVDRLYDPTAS